MRRFGLIGKSLKHSFSKTYFSKKFSDEGIKDCSYENFELPSIQDLRKKDGLNQEDKVILRISTNSDTQKLIKKYSNEIIKTTGLRDLQVDSDNKDFEIKLTIQK